MKRFFLKRILILIPMLFIISFISFSIINLSPQDPAKVALLASGVPEVTDELVHKYKEENGLNKPFLVRYKDWALNAMKLNFGKSYVTSKDVSDEILPAFKNTMSLALVTAVLFIIISVVFGVLCAIFEGEIVDRLVRFLMFIIYSMPSYWLGILFIWLFSVKLNLLPTSGMESWKSYILPSFVLSIGYFAFYFRLIRNTMIQNSRENYILFKKACGLKKFTVIKHIFINSIQTTVAGLFMSFSTLIGGTFVIESIFAWPGLGRVCISAILARDLPVIQAYILIMATSFVIFNLLADIVNAFLNPRLREG